MNNFITEASSLILLNILPQRGHSWITFSLLLRTKVESSVIAYTLNPNTPEDLCELEVSLAYTSSKTARKTLSQNKQTNHNNKN